MDTKIQIVRLRSGETLVVTEQKVLKDDWMEKSWSRPMIFSRNEDGGLNLTPFMEGLIDYDAELNLHWDVKVDASENVTNSYNEFWANVDASQGE